MRLLRETDANTDRASAVPAKRCVVTEAVEIVDLALETVGGSACYKRSPLERAYRDVRGGKLHPLTAETSLQYAGRLVLVQPIDQLW